MTYNHKIAPSLVVIRSKKNLQIIRQNRAKMAFSVLPRHFPKAVVAVGVFVFVMILLQKIEDVPHVEQLEVIADSISDAQESILFTNESEQNDPRGHVSIEDALPYALDNEEFLKLVPETYGNEDLFEWQTPAPLPRNPDEPGYMGKAVIVPPEREKEAKEKFEIHQFNLVASDMLSPNRTYPDLRHSTCMSINYPKKLPQTSIVISFYNEAWSTLIRTLWSICNKTPRALLKEIILIDDGSDHEELGERFENYIKQMPVTIKLFRTHERIGIVRARLLAAKHVTAPIITLLDAHIECNEGWLEPLLTQVAQDRSTIAIPVTDGIKYSNFEVYKMNKSIYSTLNWGFMFTWIMLPYRVLKETNNDPSAVIKSPAMLGGLLSMDKEFFYRLGTYDDQMKVWGGDEIEMSVRVWSCGGSIVMPMCSRIAHMGRKSRFYADSLPGGKHQLWLNNVIRFVETWTDEFKIFFYGMNPDVTPLATDISERQKLRKDLKCKSYRWYLENVDPENVLLKERQHLGQIENVGLEGMCLQGEIFKLSLTPCRNTGGSQLFMYTKSEQIQASYYCVDLNMRGNTIVSINCHDGTNQKWIYNNETLQFRSKVKPSYCLGSGNQTKVTLTLCDNSPNQQWTLSKIPRLQQYEEPMSPG